MMFSKRHFGWLIFAILLTCGVSFATAADDKDRKIYAVAVLPFVERGSEVRQFGSKVTDLIFAGLSADEGVVLVDREDLAKVVQEQELNLSGTVNKKEAITVGQLTGAKLLVTGSIQQIDTTLILTAKVISAETARVVGTTVRGKAKDDLVGLSDSLGEKISKVIKDRAGDLVAAPVTPEERLAALKKSLGDAKLPKVYIKVQERHVGHVTIDPAAETEITLLCTETGFKVVDAENKKSADVWITGEGMSEFAVRHGNLISVKARLELKAVDQSTGKVITADRQTTVALDLTEQIAGKSALQEAAAAMAERVLPAVAKAQANRK